MYEGTSFTCKIIKETFFFKVFITLTVEIWSFDMNNENQFTKIIKLTPIIKIKKRFCNVWLRALIVLINPHPKEQIIANNERFSKFVKIGFLWGSIL